MSAKIQENRILRTRLELECQELLRKDQRIEDNNLEIQGLIEAGEIKDREIRENVDALRIQGEEILNIADQLRAQGEEMRIWKGILSQFGKLTAKGN